MRPAQVINTFVVAVFAKGFYGKPGTETGQIDLGIIDDIYKCYHLDAHLGKSNIYSYMHVMCANTPVQM